MSWYIALRADFQEPNGRTPHLTLAFCKNDLLISDGWEVVDDINRELVHGPLHTIVGHERNDFGFHNNVRAITVFGSYSLYRYHSMAAEFDSHDFEWIPHVTLRTDMPAPESVSFTEAYLKVMD